MRISVQLARTKEQYEQAFKLLQTSHQKVGFAHKGMVEDLWLLKQHALPSSNTIIALEKNKVVGALTLFGESAFRLPLEEEVDLSSFREDLSGRLAEISLVSAQSDDRNVLLALHHFALCFGATYCHYDAFVTKVPQAWSGDYLKNFGYEPLTIKEKLNGATFYRNAREGNDLQKQISKDVQVEYHYPEKKFFLVAHQSIEANTLDYLFNQKTQLFDGLTDLELRVLKNFYDHGDFAKVLPNRSLNMPLKKTPKYRRFPMNCEGYLCLADGKRIHLQVLDVSREGIKIHTEENLPDGVYPLTLSIGIMKQAEVIANTIWSDDIAQISGLSVKSGDNNWQQLIEYLEQESLKTAA